MRVLVTRPLEDVGPLVEALNARGHRAMVEPMLTIERRADVDLPLPLDGVQALVFTSANGVRAFADLAVGRDLPAFAVGDSTAAAAREAGFATVHSAGGDVTDLARLVRLQLDPGRGALFHAAASHLAGDLQGALEDSGFTVRRAALYEAQPAIEISPALRRALTQGDLDAAVFFSPRTARTFVNLVEAANLAGTCARLQAVCLSEAVAARLAPLTWRRILIAARPEQEALLARLGEAMDEGAMTRPEANQSSKGAGGKVSSAGDDGAQAIIAAFGGIRPMAGKLDVAVSTVQGWRERGSIPAARHAEILAAAKAHGISIDESALTTSDRGGDGAAPSSADAPAHTPTMPSGALAGAAAAATQIPPSRPAADKPSAANTAPQKAATESSSGRFWGGFALGIVAVAVGAGLAIVGRDLWLTPEVAGPSAPALEARLNALEASVGTAGGAGADAMRDAVTQMESALSAVQSRLDGLAGDVAAVADDGPGAEVLAQQTAAVRAVQSDIETQSQVVGARIDALEARLAGLQNRVETGLAAGGQVAQSAVETALALSVLQLRDAVRGSGPFAAELQAVLDVAASSAVADGADLAAAVAPLQPHAQTGVPTLGALRQSFPDLAADIAARGQGAGDEDWLAGIKRRVSGLISVRPIGTVEGDSPAAVAARAEAALAGGDLAGAIAELETLQGPAAAVAQDWLAGARARLAARNALNDLGRGLIARLGAGAD